MRFIYKINSAYDGFSPTKLTTRIRNRRLGLGWGKYLDQVAKGDSVWVYFHGPHKFKPGIYVRGRVSRISYQQEKVWLRIAKFSEEMPLTDPRTSQHIAKLVKRNYQQVFVFTPLRESNGCDLFSSPRNSCSKRKCGVCLTRKSLPRVQVGDLERPLLLPPDIRQLLPAYWIIPHQCYRRRSLINSGIKKVSDLFYSFKLGEGDLAFFFALGIYDQIQKFSSKGFDCIIPVPLSPDKKKKGELHRTLAVAEELSDLLRIPCVEALRLAKPISKRRYLAQGKIAKFEANYAGALELKRPIKRYLRILILDDVCTEGRTLSIIARRLRQENTKCQFFAATAGQMILKSVVKYPSTLR